MKRPVIGVTMDSGDTKPDRYGFVDRYSLNANYPKSIEKAGGLPLAIPYHVDDALIPQIVDALDGILFIGGDDMDPRRYSDEDWHPKAIRMNDARQEFEFALLGEVERRRLPTLGVCFGSQLMNVYRGGSMHQFVPDLKLEGGIEHRKLDREDPRHAINIDTTSQVGRAIGKKQIEGNTYHKQAMNRIGKGLKVIATSPDGVIEGIEDPTFPLFTAVQWHPERMSDRAEHLALFKLLVDKARENAAGK